MLRIIILLLGLGLVVNLAALDYQLFFANKPTAASFENTADLKLEVADLKSQLEELKLSSTQSGSSSASSVSCPVSCVDLINASAKKAASPVTTSKSTATNKEYVVTLGGGTTNNIGSWQDIQTAQATIDSGNYGTISEAIFETVMHVPNGAGEVRARLVDITTPHIYDGNQLTATSKTGALSSRSISLQPGKKVYQVQLLTTISTGVLDEARIRIVSK